jgi:hypothetical protein
MTPNELRRILGVDAETVLEVLTRRQHLRPHLPLADVLRATVEELGCCPDAVRRAVERLGLDRQKPVGRLRRTELTQLARSIYRIWGQTLTHATANPQPQS